MVQQTENKHTNTESDINNRCVCLIELISVFKCSLVKKDLGRYNKLSLINNSSNKKLARTVTSGNRSEIHRSRKYPLLN